MYGNVEVYEAAGGGTYYAPNLHYQQIRKRKVAEKK